MDKGLIRRDDPAMVAFAYTAPISVISDCVTSYDLKKMDEMLAYYTAKGCEVKTLEEYMILLLDTTEDHCGRRFIDMLDAAGRKDYEYVDTTEKKISHCLGCNMKTASCFSSAPPWSMMFLFIASKKRKTYTVFDYIEI